MEEICESLDKLTVKNLELMEEKILANIQMETVLREGHIELAKARYIRGKENIGSLQIPTEDEEITSLFQLETTESKENNVPFFDISLKKSTENEIPNPIKRFGVLVPQSLRNAQKRFQEALYLSAKVANVSSQLCGIQNELQILLSEKKKSAVDCDENDKD